MVPRTLIICTSPRSGSYLLSDLLNQAGLPFADEYLTAFSESEQKKLAGIDPSQPFLDYVMFMRNRCAKDGVFCLKVMIGEMERLLEELSVLDTNNIQQAFREFFPNPVFVHLVREERLDQAISYIKAEQTGQWIKKSGETLELPFEPVYSYVGLCRAIEMLDYANRRWIDIFKTLDIRAINLSYEGLVANPNHAIKSVLSALSLEAELDDKVNLKTKMTPMRSDLNKIWKTRYLDSKSTLPRSVVPKSLDPIKIKDVRLDESYTLGKRYEFEVFCENTGDGFVDPRGDCAGNGWLSIAGVVYNKESGYESFFIHELVDLDCKGKTYVAKCLLTLPILPAAEIAGEYRVLLSVVNRIVYSSEIFENYQYEKIIHAEHKAPRQKSRQLLRGTQDLANGWQYLSWFGYFLDDLFPWIYHQDHEWLLFAEDEKGEGKFHIMDAQIGWVEISTLSYPEFFCLSDSRRLKFISRDGHRRRFLDLATQEELWFDTNRPEHLTEYI